MGGWVGWLEKWGLKLISPQVVVEVEVGVELGNMMDSNYLVDNKRIYQLRYQILINPREQYMNNERKSTKKFNTNIEYNQDKFQISKLKSPNVCMSNKVLKNVNNWARSKT